MHAAYLVTINVYLIFYSKTQLVNIVLKLGDSAHSTKSNS